MLSLSRSRLTCVALTLLLPLGAHADGRRLPKKNIVIADLGLHVVAVGYQRTIASNIALSASVGLYDPWTTTDKVGDIRGGILRVRPYVFLSDDAPRGWWFSPFAQGGVVRGIRAGVEKQGLALSVGAALGYAFLIANVLHLSFGLGGQAHAAQVSGGSTPPSFQGAWIHADATVGVAF